VWLALVRAVTAVLLTDLARAEADISSSHVLEHCLTRLDHGVYGAELAPLLAGVMQPAVLRSILRRPASLHLVKGLIALFAGAPQFAAEARALRVTAQVDTLEAAAVGYDGYGAREHIDKVVQLVHARAALDASAAAAARLAGVGKWASAAMSN
jgi:hypothetical protein